MKHLSEKIWTHSQNLNVDSKDKVKGPMWVYGRWWLHLREWIITLCWHFGPTSTLCMGQFSLNKSEREMSICFAIWKLFYLSLSVEGWPFLKYTTIEDDLRIIGWRIFGGGLWLDFWSEPAGWGPRRDLNIFPARIVFGYPNHTKRTISTQDVVIPMPEGEYPATLEVYESTWKRPRWPFVKRMMRFSIDMSKPIPVPGKGENSWDIDDDAIFSMSGGEFTTAEDAIEQVIKSAMRDRDRYGGRHWQPENS